MILCSAKDNFLVQCVFTVLPSNFLLNADFQNFKWYFHPYICIIFEMLKRENINKVPNWLFLYKGHGQGHKVVDLGVIWKGFISWVCMQIMKSLSFTVQKLWLRLKFFLPQSHSKTESQSETGQKLDALIIPFRGHTKHEKYPYVIARTCILPGCALCQVVVVQTWSSAWASWSPWIHRAGPQPRVWKPSVRRSLPLLNYIHVICKVKGFFTNGANIYYMGMPLHL